MSIYDIPEDLEDVIEGYLDKRITAIGGFTRKTQYVGRRGCVDRLVFYNGVYFVECKRPKKRQADDHQAREHIRLAVQGVPVLIINTRQKVDLLVEELLNKQPGSDLL